MFIKIKRQTLVHTMKLLWLVMATVHDENNTVAFVDGKESAVGAMLLVLCFVYLNLVAVCHDVRYAKETDIVEISIITRCLHIYPAILYTVVHTLISSILL